jgi:hypothetical protein
MRLTGRMDRGAEFTDDNERLRMAARILEPVAGIDSKKFLEALVASTSGSTERTPISTSTISNTSDTSPNPNFPSLSPAYPHHALSTVSAASLGRSRATLQTPLGHSYPAKPPAGQVDFHAFGIPKVEAPDQDPDLTASQLPTTTTDSGAAAFSLHRQSSWWPEEIKFSIPLQHPRTNEAPRPQAPFAPTFGPPRPPNLTSSVTSMPTIYRRGTSGTTNHLVSHHHIGNQPHQPSIDLDSLESPHYHAHHTQDHPASDISHPFTLPEPPPSLLSQEYDQFLPSPFPELEAATFFPDGITIPDDQNNLLIPFDAATGFGAFRCDGLDWDRSVIPPLVLETLMSPQTEEASELLGSHDQTTEGLPSRPRHKAKNSQSRDANGSLRRILAAPSSHAIAKNSARKSHNRTKYSTDQLKKVNETRKMRGCLRCWFRHVTVGSFLVIFVLYLCLVPHSHTLGYFLS